MTSPVRVVDALGRIFPVMGRSSCARDRWFRRLLAAVLFLGVVGLLLRTSGLWHLSPVGVERIQLGLWPVIFAVLWLAPVNLPRRIFLVAGVSVMLSLLSAYTHILLGQEDKLFIARLDDDPSEATTRIFREQFNQYLAGQQFRGKAIRHFGAVASDREARELFTQNPALDGVLWGATDWVNLSLPLQHAPALGELAGERAAALSSFSRGLLLVQSIPVVGLPLEPAEATRAFIGLLSPVLFEPAPLTGDSDASARWAARESGLFSAGTLGSLWNSSYHRAFPLWRSATDRVMQFVAAGSLDTALLECADRELQRARTYLPKGSGPPETRAALLNNHAIVLILLAEQRGDATLLKSAFELLRAAAATRKVRETLKVDRHNAAVAATNFTALRKALFLERPAKGKGTGHPHPKQKRKKSP